jgi:hypothetical protein
MKHILRRRCTTCGENYDVTYDNRRDYAAAAQRMPNPFYCQRHNPKILHDAELVEACRAVLGVKFFDLGCFRKYGFANEYVRIIDRLKYSEDHIERADGTHEQHIDSVMVWSMSTGEKLNHRDDTWTSLSSFAALRDATPADVDEIKAIVTKILGEFTGCARVEFTAGYMAILKRIETVDFKVLP